MTDEVAAPPKGIKETQEMLDALNEITIFLMRRFRDGVQFEDFTAFYAEIISDPDMKDLMLKAFDGYEQIPGEVDDIDVSEACALSCQQIGFIPRIIGSLKKPQR